MVNSSASNCFAQSCVVSRGVYRIRSAKAVSV